MVLGAIAQATTRVRLGTVATPVPRRRPWRVAKEVTTLDHLSGGRAVLGVGLGVPVDGDFGAFGEATDDRVRAAMLDEGLDVITALWSGDRVVHAGEHFRVDATFAPVPVQRPRPPIWVAGRWPNRRPFERAAQWDGVVPMLADPDGIGLCRPDDVRAIVTFVQERRSTDEPFDVVVSPHWDHEPAEYADAGATWLIQSRNADPDWLDQLRPRIEAGPRPA